MGGIALSLVGSPRLLIYAGRGPIHCFDCWIRPVTARNYGPSIAAQPLPNLKEQKGTWRTPRNSPQLGTSRKLNCSSPYSFQKSQIREKYNGGF